MRNRYYALDMEDDDWKLLSPMEYAQCEQQSWGGGPGLPFCARFGSITLQAIVRRRKATMSKDEQAVLKAQHVVK